MSSLRNPGKEFSPARCSWPWGLVLLIFILPALAIGLVHSGRGSLSLTAGIMQAFEAVFAQFGIG